jgi:hypothetical protein
MESYGSSRLSFAAALAPLATPPMTITFWLIQNPSYVFLPETKLLCSVFSIINGTLAICSDDVTNAPQNGNPRWGYDTVSVKRSRYHTSSFSAAPPGARKRTEM